MSGDAFIACLHFLGAMLSSIMAIELPFGITFGGMLIGVCFFGVLVSVLRAIFTRDVGDNRGGDKGD